MRAYTLAMTVAFCISLIGLLEYLSHVAASKGGISFANENGQFTTLQSFSYLYLPTIVSVCFGMFYAWIDLDVRRLEPFFQLSGPNGALAEESISLQWPLEFLALVPIKAAKVRYGYQRTEACYT